MAEQAHQARPNAPVEIVWQPQKGPQHAFVTCPIFEVFYGGARGGGKTDGFLGEFARHAGRYGRDAIGLAIRRERTQLIETIERSRAMYTQIGAVFHEQEKMWRFPNGARLRFAYLERDSDAEAYQGHSYTRVYVEEITNFPDPKPLLKLMATLRSGAGVPCGFRATGNPGGPGHHWVKQRYIDPAPNGMQPIKETFKNPWSGEVVERERIYIPARVTDNKFLGIDYVANLQMAGSAQLVRAWLSGDWSVIEGAFFDCWSHQRHVVRPFVFPSDWSRIRAADWGSAKPFCILWLAVVTDDYTVEHLTLPRGALVVYREWYGSPNDNNTGLKLTAETVAEGIRVRETTEEITNAVLDPAAFSSDGGPSIAERMATRDVIFRRADNKRVTQKGAMGGWDQVRSRLIGEAEDRPMLVVFETCRNLIRTLPALQHDENKPEDVDTDSEDHACFAAGTVIDGIGAVEDFGTLTRCDTDVVRVDFEDGNSVVCTPDHLFLGADSKWHQAMDLQGRQLCSGRLPRSSLASGITSAGSITSARVADFIARCGSIITGQYRPARTFTTATATVATTGSTTSNSWMGGRILPITGGSIPANLVSRQGMQLADGIRAWLAESGTRPTGTEALAKWWQTVSQSLARFAGNRMRRAASASVSRAFATRTAKPLRCVAVEPLNEKRDVYCLATSEAYLTVNGGIIASNCDALRYGCMSRPWAAALPQKPKPLLDWRSQTLDQLWSEHDQARNRHY